MTALVNPFWYGAAATDPNFASVVLLLHFDGANGARTFPDNSLAAHSVTSTGGSAWQLTTAQQKFGVSSLQCGTTGWTSAADSADWAFGAGQFTVECWIRPTSAISGVRGIVTQFGGSTDYGWFFGFNGNTLNFFYSTTGTDNPAVTGAYTPTQNVWTHIAADRNASNVLRVYAGGVVLASSTVSATFFDSTRTLRIGDDENLTRQFAGQIDEMRITKGVARYGGAFTPPTAPFPDA